MTAEATFVDEVILTGSRREQPRLDAFVVVRAESPAELTAYRSLRRDVFVTEQGLFAGTDHDDVDDDPRTVVLVARAHDGEVLGGVRLHPATAPDLGWWRGSRLAVATDARMLLGVGAALVRAACAQAETLGALRFDATVQAQHERLFRHLGWLPSAPSCTVTPTSSSTGRSRACSASSTPPSPPSADCSSR